MKNLVVNSVEVKLEVVENEIFTTSLQVAEVFEKEHKNVLRDLEKFKVTELNFELSDSAKTDEFFKKNFILSEYRVVNHETDERNATKSLRDIS